MPMNKDWYYARLKSERRQELARIARIKKQTSAKKKPKKQKKAKKAEFGIATVPYSAGMGQDFYNTKEWRRLRWKVLTEGNGMCAMCGATAKSSGAPMHVDHKQPRRYHPGLELVKDNLQVLCMDCNLGKGATTWSR